MFHTAVLCRFNSVISSLTVFWEKKRLGRNEVWCEHRNSLLRRSVDLSCCKIQKTGFSKKNELISLRSTKLQPSHKYSTHNHLLFPVHSIVHCGHHPQHGHQCDNRVPPRRVSAYEDPLSWLLLLFETKLSFKTLLPNGHWLIPWRCSRTEAMRHEIGSFFLKIPEHFNKAVIKFMF